MKTVGSKVNDAFDGKLQNTAGSLGHNHVVGNELWFDTLKPV